MLLTVDIGNSAIKFGVFDGEHLVARHSIPTKRVTTADSLTSAIGTKLDLPIDDAMVCSVVPDADPAVREFLKTTFQIEPFFVTVDVDLGLEIRYFDLSSLGVDRLVNAFAASQRYGLPVIVCSFGSATTIDAVNAEYEFLAGLIAPGMQMMADALHHFTSKLPAVDVRWEGRVVTPSTEDCIRAGISYCQSGLVETAVRDLRKDIGDAKLVATGGFAQLIADHTGQIDIVDENLLLDGLRLVHERLST
jgi:type III pantothenate kinase